MRRIIFIGTAVVVLIAASVAVAAGVMKTGPDSSFQPSRTVTGAEAIDVITALQAMAGTR